MQSLLDKQEQGEENDDDVRDKMAAVHSLVRIQKKF